MRDDYYTPEINSEEDFKNFHLPAVDDEEFCYTYTNNPKIMGDVLDNDGESFDEDDSSNVVSIELIEDVEPPADRKLVNIKKISFETIHFMDDLSKIRKSAKFGIRPFSDYNDEEAIYYDDDENSAFFGEAICEIGYDYESQQPKVEKYWKELYPGLIFRVYTGDNTESDWRVIRISYEDAPEQGTLIFIGEGFSIG